MQTSSTSVKSFNSRTWVKIIAQCMLLWVICQSALAATMPVDMETDCCPSDSAHVVHEHNTSDTAHLHELAHPHKTTMASADGHHGSHHDHTHCEHCVFGCQFITSAVVDAVHEFTAQKAIIFSAFSLISSSLDLPFRPPILL